MSTKSTIARVSAYTWLEEEMLDDSTWLIADNPNMVLYGNGLGAQLRLHLTAALIDKIAEIHAERGFHHQRPNTTHDPLAQTSS